MKKEYSAKNLDELQAAARKIESRLDSEKTKLKNYNEIQDNIDSIAKRLSSCYALFRDSMKGPVVDEEIDDMENANVTFYKNARNYLEKHLTETNTKIESFKKEKEGLHKKIKELLEEDYDSKEK